MPRLVLTPEALTDVQRLYRFLAEKSPDAARRAVAAIRGAVKPLALHPEIGRPVPDLSPEFRDWIANFGNSGYIVRYRLTADSVVLLAVRHQLEAGF